MKSHMGVDEETSREETKAFSGSKATSGSVPMAPTAATPLPSFSCSIAALDLRSHPVPFPRCWGEVYPLPCPWGPYLYCSITMSPRCVLSNVPCIGTLLFFPSALLMVYTDFFFSLCSFFMVVRNMAEAGSATFIRNSFSKVKLLNLSGPPMWGSQ